MVAANPSHSDALAAALRRAQLAWGCRRLQRRSSEALRSDNFVQLALFQAPEQLHSRSPTGLAVGFGSRATLEALCGFFHP